MNFRQQSFLHRASAIAHGLFVPGRLTDRPQPNKRNEMPSEPPAEPVAISEIKQTLVDAEIRRLRAMLETYRCDNRIPQSAFAGLLATVALQEYLEQEK